MEPLEEPVCYSTVWGTVPEKLEKNGSMCDRVVGCCESWTDDKLPLRFTLFFRHVRFSFFYRHGVSTSSLRPWLMLWQSMYAFGLPSSPRTAERQGRATLFSFGLSHVIRVNLLSWFSSSFVRCLQEGLGRRRPVDLYGEASSSAPTRVVSAVCFPFSRQGLTSLLSLVKARTVRWLTSPTPALQ